MGAASGLLRPRLCGLGSVSGFSIPNETSISWLVLIRLSRASSYSGSSSATGSGGVRRRLRGLASFLKLLVESRTESKAWPVDTTVVVRLSVDALSSAVPSSRSRLHLTPHDVANAQGPAPSWSPLSVSELCVDEPYVCCEWAVFHEA